jgi:hypothetical protein
MKHSNKLDRDAMEDCFHVSVANIQSVESTAIVGETLFVTPSNDAFSFFPSSSFPPTNPLSRKSTAVSRLISMFRLISMDDPTHRNRNRGNELGRESR